MFRGAFRLRGTMIAVRILAGLVIVLAMTACAALPRSELDALLAAEGVSSYSILSASHSRFTEWRFVVQDSLHEVAPKICMTHARLFDVIKSSDGYHVAHSSAEQRVALKNCSGAKDGDFIAASSHYNTMNALTHDVTDDELRRFLQAAIDLPRLAASGGGSVRIRYESRGGDTEHLRAALQRLNSEGIKLITVDSPQVATVTIPQRFPAVIAVTFTFEDGHLAEVLVSETAQIVTSDEFDSLVRRQRVLG